METYRQIQLFLQLTKTLHFSQTAEKMKISQAALSKEIQNLERSLGCRLLDRSDKRRIVITDAGKAYLNHIQNVPTIIARAGNCARKAERGELGTLSIAITQLVYEYLNVGNMLRRFYLSYPDINLQIHDFLGAQEVIDAVSSGRFDSGLIIAGRNRIREIPDFLTVRELQRLPLAFAIPVNHPFANRQDLNLMDFEDCNLILPFTEEGAQLSSWSNLLFSGEGKLPLKENLKAHGMKATLQLASSGLGIGLVLEPTAPLQYENLVFWRLPVSRYGILALIYDSGNQSRVLKNMLGQLPQIERNDLI